MLASLALCFHTEGLKRGPEFTASRSGVEHGEVDLRH